MLFNLNIRGVKLKILLGPTFSSVTIFRANKGPIFSIVTILRANKGSYLAPQNHVTETGIMYSYVKSIPLMRGEMVIAKVTNLLWGRFPHGKHNFTG